MEQEGKASSSDEGSRYLGPSVATGATIVVAAGGDGDDEHQHKSSRHSSVCSVSSTPAVAAVAVAGTASTDGRSSGAPSDEDGDVKGCDANVDTATISTKAAAATGREATAVAASTESPAAPPSASSTATTAALDSTASTAILTTAAGVPLEQQVVATTDGGSDAQGNQEGKVEGVGTVGVGVVPSLKRPPVEAVSITSTSDDFREVRGCIRGGNP